MIKSLLLGLLMSVCTITACKKNSPHGQEDTHSPSPSIDIITNETRFQEKVNASSIKPLIIKVETAWCSSCKSLKPKFETAAIQLRQDYDFAILDLDQAKALGQKLNITAVPVILFFKQGKELNVRLVGDVFDSGESLTTEINKIMQSNK